MVVGNEIRKETQEIGEEELVKELETVIEKELQEEPKEIHEKIKEESTKTDKLVKLYVLSFELPSMALAILERDWLIDKDTGFIKEINTIESELKSKIETLRRQFYRECEKLFETSYLGWVTFTEEGIKFAEEWNNKFKEELRGFVEKLKMKKQKFSDPKIQELYDKLINKLLIRLEKRSIKVIKVYLEYEDAVELLNSIVSKLNSEVEELRKQIKEIEEKLKEEKKKELKKKFYEYNAKLTLLERKLKMFKESLESI